MYLLSLEFASPLGRNTGSDDAGMHNQKAYRSWLQDSISKKTAKTAKEKKIWKEKKSERMGVYICTCIYSCIRMSPHTHAYTCTCTHTDG